MPLLPRVTDDALAAILSTHLGARPDLVAAITSDGAYPDLVRRLDRDYGSDPAAIDRAVAALAEEVDHGLADWLVDVADQPAVWVISRLS